MSQINEQEQQIATEAQVQGEMDATGVNADDSVAGTHGVEEELQAAAELETLRQELAAQKDKYLRLFAEFDNFKRRTAAEKNELRQTANRELMTALLDVLDDCDRTDKVLADSTDIEAIKTGVGLVFHKLRSTLEQKGLQAMASISQTFDADLHEAITEIPAPSEALQGKVIDELQKGYSLGGKIIRYAKVVVGK